jgi:prevent-host-death family protein
VPHYSVATTKDKLASLIDKALAGEEVIITRHGKPTVELRVVSSAKGDREGAFDRLRDLREALPPSNVSIPIERFSDWLYEEEEQD